MEKIKNKSREREALLNEDVLKAWYPGLKDGDILELRDNFCKIADVLKSFNDNPVALFVRVGFLLLDTIEFSDSEVKDRLKKYVAMASLVINKGKEKEEEKKVDEDFLADLERSHPRYIDDFDSNAMEAYDTTDSFGPKKIEDEEIKITESGEMLPFHKGEDKTPAYGTPARVMDKDDSG